MGWTTGSWADAAAEVDGCGSSVSANLKIDFTTLSSQLMQQVKLIKPLSKICFESFLEESRKKAVNANLVPSCGKTCKVSPCDRRNSLSVLAGEKRISVPGN